MTSGRSTGPRWVSLHVYYGDDQDRLLVDGVAPLLRRLRADRLLGGYFFLRYDLGGPHIRLRLSPAGPEYASPLESRARAGLEAYVAAHPSSRSGGRVRDVVRDTYLQRWNRVPERPDPDAPNNSVWRAEYRPEVERYGSGAGLRTVENHFERSSQLALEIIRHTPRERRADVGLELLLAAPAALGEAACWPDYYRWHRNNWLGNPPPDWPAEAVFRLLTNARLRLRATAVRQMRGMLAGQPATVSAASRWRKLLTELVGDFTAVRSLAPDRTVAFAAAMTHLLLNRCGLSPVVEGCLADVALTAYQEASYV